MVEVVLGWLLLACELVIDIAELGRAIEGMGEVEPFCAPDEDAEDGCCRTAKTKVLFKASLAHCGCETYRS